MHQEIIGYKHKYFYISETKRGLVLVESFGFSAMIYTSIFKKEKRENVNDSEVPGNL